MLKSTYSQVYERLEELPWTQDSITGAEHDAVEWFYWLSSRNWRATVTLLDLPWLQDSITETERDAVEWLYWLAREDWKAYEEVISKPFLQTLEADDVQTIREMSGRESQSYLGRLSESYPEVARPLQGLPWPQPPYTETELHAIEYLYWLAREDRQAGTTVTALPWVHDGITTAESEAINRIYELSRREKALAATVISLPWVRDDITLTESEVLKRLDALAHEDENLAAAVTALPWVQDDITNTEHDAIRQLYWLTEQENTRNTANLEAVFSLPWIQDDITETEEDFINFLESLDHRNEKAAAMVIAMPWAHDTITEPKANTVRYLDWIGRKDSEAVSSIIAMPFLKSVDLDDVLALMAVNRFAVTKGDGRFEALMEHPTLRNGITDDLTTLVTAAGVIREAGEVRRMLNPGYAKIEVLTEGTALTPDLKISIVRTENSSWEGAAQGLKFGVELVESAMRLPLPIPHVIVVINDLAITREGPGAQFHGFAIGIHTRNEKPVQYASGKDVLHSTYTHEIAHNYFTSDFMESWLSEGVPTTFEYIYRLEGKAPSEVPPEMLQVNLRGDCDAHDLRMQSERGKSAQSSCKYYLGLGLFRELAEAMGHEAYYAGLRRLYHLSLEIRDSGGTAGIAEVRQAFPDQSEIVEKHWSGKLNAPENRTD